MFSLSTLGMVCAVLLVCRFRNHVKTKFAFLYISPLIFHIVLFVVANVIDPVSSHASRLTVVK
jgi:hypothetical protein